MYFNTIVECSVVLGVVLGAAAVTIVFVHQQQNADRAKMHQGVVRDMQRVSQSQIKKQ